MQSAVQKSKREIPIIQEFNIEIIEQASCLQIREKLDALFDGDSRLEETQEMVKRVLLRHLETCDACCRSFDVRVRFRVGGRKGIL